MRHPWRVRTPLIVVVAAAVSLAAAGDGATAPAPRGPAVAPVWHAGRPAPPAVDIAPSPVREVSGPPTRLRVARLGIDSGLGVLGLDKSGALEAPRDYGQAGWYGGGPVPGDAGPAVIAGHVDSKTGPAVFYRLHELRAGDVVEVRRGSRWVSFRVTGTTRHRKDEFPTAAVYSPTPGPELRLVTCGGTFDQSRNSYRDNVVVFAVAEPDVIIPKSAAG